MTHCYNCGHTGTFVLLVQFALAVPDYVADRSDRRSRSRSETDHSRNRSSDRRRSRDRPHDWSQSCDPNHSRRRSRRRNATSGHSGGRDDSPGRSSGQDDFPPWNGRPTALGFPTEGDLSLAVQCPACDSTDVNVAPVDLLARYESNTTS